MANLEQRTKSVEDMRVRSHKRRRALSLLGVVVVIATALALMVPALSATHSTMPAGVDGQNGGNVTIMAGRASADLDAPADNTTEFSQEVANPVDGTVVSVTAIADEGVFPEGATMAATWVSDDAVLYAAKKEVAQSKGIAADKARAVAVDIAFYDAEGNEIEPVGDVDVSISSHAVSVHSDLAVVHVDDLSGAEVVPVHTVMPEEESVTFTANAFSVYALVYTVDALKAEGDSYTITVTYGDGAEIPDGSTLTVRELQPESQEYASHLEAAAEKLDAGSVDEIGFARFFDIEIQHDGQKVEPKVPVQVKINCVNPLEIIEGTKLSIVHFAEEGGEVTPEVIDDVALNEQATEITYLQGSFSVTAVVIDATNSGEVPNKPSNYAVLIKRTVDGADKYYAVESDGSLVEVGYDPQTNTVTLGYPLEWSFTSAHDGLSDDTYSTNGSDIHQDWQPYNIRMAADCRRYNGFQLPEGTYFRYISPRSANGISEESVSNPHHGIGYQEQVNNPNNPYGYMHLDGAKFYNGLQFQDGKLSDIHFVNGQNISDGLYIGADFDSMHIIGQQNEGNAATVVLARITEVPPVGANNETVSHIDIGVVGHGILDVPLAYGTYYDANGNELFEVSKGNDVTLHLTKDIDINKEDIMRASLKAYDKNGNELDDAFYITGYTANEHTDHSAVQVRMEGSFKVSTLDPYTPSNADSNLDADRRHNRLDNQVYYRLTTTKEVEFDLVDANGTQLYDARGKKLTVKAQLLLNESFSYWSDKNECPPVLDDFEEKYRLGNPVPPYGHNNRWWQDGAIIANEWGNRYPDSPSGGGLAYSLPGDSGMDFVLGSKADAEIKVPAVEVVKMIVDENGNRIHSAKNVTNNIELYYKSGEDASSVAEMGIDPDQPLTEDQLESLRASYTPLRTEDVVVGQDGIGMFYDYDVDEGMFLVRENKDPMQEGGANQVITDVDGRTWLYKETEVQTEYVWRDNDNTRHYAEGYTSIPEALGTYEFGGRAEYNTFLEFYVYNVYELKEYPVYIKKIEEGASASSVGLAGAEFELYGPFEQKTDAWRDPDKHIKSVTSTTDVIKIDDLKDGVYYLDETKAPAGHNIPSGPIVITVDSSKESSQDGPVSYSLPSKPEGEVINADVITLADETSAYQLNITNSSGAVLPNTGGTGTTYLYIIGGLLVAAALAITCRARLAQAAAFVRRSGRGGGRR